MPIKLKDELFAMPGENDTQGPTGREIMGIEETFGLDGLELLGVLEGEKLHANPAYSRTKALYSLAWICLTRAGKILSLDDVLNTYSIDEIRPMDDETESKKDESTVEDSVTAALVN